jgi:hypothetical protein
MVPWAGLQYLPVLFAEGVVLFLFFSRRYWKEITASFLGAGLGGAGFMSVVAISGRLPSYLKFVHAQQRLGPRMLAVWLRTGHLNHTNVIPADFSLPFIVVAVIVLLIYLLRYKIVCLRSVLPYTLAYCALLSGILIISSRFPTYYSYMVSIPLAVAVCHGLSLCQATSVRCAVLIICLLSAASGVGLNATTYASNWQDRNYDHVEQLVSSTVHADDIAFVDFTSYYAAKKRAMDVFFQYPEWDILPLMSKEQKDSITVILVRPEEAGNVIHGLGGAWNQTGDMLAPSKRGLFEGRGLGFLSHDDNKIQVFRRRNELAQANE